VNSYDLVVSKVGGKSGNGKKGNDLLDGHSLRGDSDVVRGDTADSLPASAGGDVRSQVRVFPAIEFVPVADEPGHLESPVRPAAEPVAVGSQAMRLLLELDPLLQDGSAYPTWAAGNMA
jgi:hypothetical protein